MLIVGILGAPETAESDDAYILLGSCIPPADPYPFEPPDDPELRALINEDYQTFLVEAETYLNCLQAETGRAIEKTNQVLRRYVEAFGNEAGVRAE